MTADMRPGEERTLLSSGRLEDAYMVAQEYGFVGSFAEFSLIYQQEKTKDEQENRQKLLQEQNERNRKLVQRLLRNGG